MIRCGTKALTALSEDQQAKPPRLVRKDWIMRAKLISVVAVIVSFQAGADEAATKVTGDELRMLVTGAKVHHVNSLGSERRWVNEPDGTLVASSTGKKYGGAFGVPSSSSGKWSIDDAGKYCIEIDWKRELEKWCASIVKGQDGTHYLSKVDPSRKIEFAR
jgi:hypothetical protein